MKNAFLKIHIILSLIFFIYTGNLFAQFEQKLTLQASAGFVEALGPESFTDIFFHGGFSIDAGVQYNFSRRVSIVAMGKYSTFFYDSDPDFALEEMKYNMLGINLCPKLRFLPYSRFNPYLYGGASVNYISITHNLAGEGPETSTSPLSLGSIVGAGADLRLNDNIALFAQGGLNWVDQGSVWIESFFIQLGVNINMFKARTL